MSSIVKKSGTRFVPKNTQRKSVALSREASRALTDTETPSSTRPASIEPVAQPSGEVEDDEDDGDEDIEENERGVEMPQFKTVSFASGISGQSNQPAAVSSENIQRRRLSSISSGLKAGLLKRPSTDMEPFKINVPSVPNAPSATSSGRPGRKSSSVSKSVYAMRKGSKGQAIDPVTPVSVITSAKRSSNAIFGDETVANAETEVEHGGKKTKVSEKVIPESGRITRRTRRQAALHAEQTASTNSGGTRDVTQVDGAKDIVYTPAELAEQVKYYMDPDKNQLQRVSLAKFSKMKVDESRVISDISSLQTISSKANYKLLENFVIDDKQITLEELCKPIIPIGKVSENFERAQKGDELRMKRRIENRQQRQLARQNRMPILEDGSSGNAILEGQRETANDLMEGKTAADANGGGSGAVQLKMHNGTVVVEEDSLYVDRHESRGADDRERENDNPYQNLITSASYGKRKFADRWTRDEDIVFFKALSSWGTDFGLISQLFPYRTRRQIKSKFIAEEKRNPHLVELALVQKLPVDFDKFALETKKEFKTLKEYNEEIAGLRSRHDLELKEMRAMRDKARQEDLEVQKRKELEIKNGTRNVSRREQIMAMRLNEEVIGTIEDKKSVVQ
ncbi:unnamed protein product [Kuraishia capsulata CBS 1993]|uniref:Myb-like domain-containing protein n=1 Tax=Kuraishia capsulata CBS 1993 TaxID=1382522 RepID=W6MK71_9ASCO|nr:uncharacterized protein KUCA_T00000959001 [Kuraishia capsulata CBS 1993]CDK24992.1 unnamed protein product [Kuraishia capsulata CBS 1993]